MNRSSRPLKTKQHRTHSVMCEMRKRMTALSMCVLIGLPLNALQAQTTFTRLPNLGDGAQVPLGVERRLGESIAREIYRDPDYIDDVVLSDYVQSLWQVLLASARQRGELTPELDQQFAWDVSLIRDRSINAFALPGGYLGVHLGLIAAVASPDELASVLAHELSHVTQRHIARMMSQQERQTPMMMGAMILGVLAASRTGNPSGASAANALMVGGQAAAIQNQLNFSRDMEREADRIGYGVMVDAGYEPQGFVTMFEKLQQAARLNDNGAFPYLRSHPMTTERIADAQARQQLLPSKTQTPPNATHAMMAARAQVLSNPGVDVLRALSAQADSAVTKQAPLARQAGALYAAVMAEMRQSDFKRAQQHLTQLQALSLDANAQRVVRWLRAEWLLQTGAPAQAVALLSAPNALTQTADRLHKDRATTMLLARSRVATQNVEEAKLASQALVVWLNQQPRDAGAWMLLSAAYEQQGDGLRAIRAQAEARAMALDYPAAIDRFKAAQDLSRQLARENKLDRAGNIEAAIVDARLRELEALRREQALQR